MSAGEPVATLWQLAFDANRLSCVIYRKADGFQLRVESATHPIFWQSFELQPRLLARARALRDSLKRRGWTDVN